MSATGWDSQTVAQLKDECTKRGLDTTGRKADIVLRLQNYEAEQAEAEQGEQAEAEQGEQAEAEQGEQAEGEQAEGEQGDQTEEIVEGQEEAATGEGEENYEEVPAHDGDEVTDEVPANEEAALAEPEAQEEMDTNATTQEESSQEHVEMEVSEQEETKKEEEVVDVEPRFKDTQPAIKSFLSYRGQWMHMSTLIVGPMTIEETQKPELLPWFELSIYSDIYYRHLPDKTFKAFAKLIYASPHEALENIDKIKETCGVEARLKPKSSGAGIRSEMSSLSNVVFGCSKEPAAPIQCVIVDNIPSSVQMDKELGELFPDAENVFLVRPDREDMNKHEGFGFLIYPSESDATAAIEAKRGEEIRLGGNKLRLRKFNPERKDPRPRRANPNQSALEKLADERDKVTKEMKCNNKLSHWIVSISTPRPALTDEQLKKEFVQFGTVDLVYHTAKITYIAMRKKVEIERSCRSYFGQRCRAKPCELEKLKSIIDQHKKQLANMYIKAETIGNATTDAEQTSILKQIRTLEKTLHAEKRTIQWGTRPKVDLPKTPERSAPRERKSLAAKRTTPQGKKNVPQAGAKKNGTAAAGAKKNGTAAAGANKPAKNAANNAVKKAIKRVNPPSSRSSSVDANKRRRTKSGGHNPNQGGGRSSRPQNRASNYNQNQNQRRDYSAGSLDRRGNMGRFSGLMGNTNRNDNYRGNVGSMGGNYQQGFGAAAGNFIEDRSYNTAYGMGNSNYDTGMGMNYMGNFGSRTDIDNRLDMGNRADFGNRMDHDDRTNFDDKRRYSEGSGMGASRGLMGPPAPVDRDPQQQTAQAVGLLMGITQALSELAGKDGARPRPQIEERSGGQYQGNYDY